jgi:hypothetical protein
LLDVFRSHQLEIIFRANRNVHDFVDSKFCRANLFHW